MRQAPSGKTQASANDNEPIIHFVTYGNDAFDEAKRRIAAEAQATGRFASVRVCCPEDVSDEVRASPLFAARRGAGYWIWKPDVILSELNRIEDGALLFYSDAGCCLFDSPEWNRFIANLLSHDILAFRMWHRTYRWTKRECLEHFAGNPKEWIRGFQFFATFIGFRKTDFTIRFLRDWRDTMLRFPGLVGDVQPSERDRQLPGFIEHRHDQSIFSALVYRHAASGRVLPLWEHSDTLDPFASQAVFNARKRKNASKPPPIPRRIVFSIAKRICFRLFDWFDPSVRDPFASR